MSNYVMILVAMMSSYDGGVSIGSVPFATREACEQAAEQWRKAEPHPYRNNRTKVFALCHATGAKP